MQNVEPVDINEERTSDWQLEIRVGMCIPDPQDEDQDIVVSADMLERGSGLNHLTTVQRMVLDAAGIGDGRRSGSSPGPLPSPCSVRRSQSWTPGLAVNTTRRKTPALCLLRQSHDRTSLMYWLYWAPTNLEPLASAGPGQHGKARCGCCVSVRARSRRRNRILGTVSVFLVVWHARPARQVESYAFRPRLGGLIIEDQPPPGRERPRRT